MLCHVWKYGVPVYGFHGQIRWTADRCLTIIQHLTSVDTDNNNVTNRLKQHMVYCMCGKTNNNVISLLSEQIIWH